MKICQYLRLHMKMSRRFHIKTTFTFWDMRTWDMWKVCLHTYFLRNLQTLRENNSWILRIKKTKLFGYPFDMNTGISGDFQICISVLLIDCVNIWKMSVAANLVFQWTLVLNSVNCKFFHVSIVKARSSRSRWI